MVDTCPVIRAKDALTLKMESAHRQRRVLLLCIKRSVHFCAVFQHFFFKNRIFGVIYRISRIFFLLFFI